MISVVDIDMDMDMDTNMISSTRNKIHFAETCWQGRCMDFPDFMDLGFEMRFLDEFGCYCLFVYGVCCLLGNVLQQ